MTKSKSLLYKYSKLQQMDKELNLAREGRVSRESKEAKEWLEISGCIK